LPQRVRIDVLIETFHGSDHRSVPIPHDRYERASILSTDSFLVNAGEALERVAEKQWWHARTSRVRTCITTGARPRRVAAETRETGETSETRGLEVRDSRVSELRTPNFRSHPSRMSRALRFTVCSVGELFQHPAIGACPTLPFVTRRRRCAQMRGRRPGKTGGVFAGIH